MLLMAALKVLACIMLVRAHDLCALHTMLTSASHLDLPVHVVAHGAQGLTGVCWGHA